MKINKFLKNALFIIGGILALWLVGLCTGAVLYSFKGFFR